MGPKAQQARERIIDAADHLFYTQGFDHTSFADIANAVQISRGNFYYHFRTKDEILEAVIGKRLNELQNMLAQWSQEISDPFERIMHYIDIMTRNQHDIQKHGCPYGSLCVELSKLNHNQLEGANQIFTVLRNWITAQLTELNVKGNREAIAMHVLGRAQGIAVMTNAFNDPAFLSQEVNTLKQWLNDLIPSSTTP